MCVYYSLLSAELRHFIKAGASIPTEELTEKRGAMERETAASFITDRQRDRGMERERKTRREG